MVLLNQRHLELHTHVGGSQRQVARDARADRSFVYSVRTTGVYCRPSCAARTPRPENVAFHATTADAERAGFRPCRRCKPDQAPLLERQAALVAKLCRHIEAADRMPSLDELAKHAGISAHHLHRTFKAAIGLTPRAYAAAHRAKRLRAALDRGVSVTDAIYGAGYSSNGRFYEESDGVLGMTPSAWRAGGANTDIRFAVGLCSLGSILVAASVNNVNACANGAVSGQWLPGLPTSQALKAGVVSGDQVLDAAGVKTLSTMPGLAELRARLLGLLQAPATQLVRLLSTPATQLAQVMKAHQDKEEGK